MAALGMNATRLMLGLAVLLAVAAPSRAQAPAGVTAAVNPQATGTPPTLPTKVLEVGSDIVQNERVSVGAGGQAQLLFRDGSTLTLAPNSDLTIDRFVYDPEAKTATLAMTAATGVFRFVGGRASKDEPVVLNTPTATIGIRGGINFTSIAPETGATETSQAFGKSTSVTSKSTGETQTLTRNGFTLSVQPNQPITIGKMDMGRINGMLASLQGTPGKSGGAGAAPSQSSPAATSLALSNSAQSPLTNQPTGSITGSVAPASGLGAALVLANQVTQSTAQSTVPGTLATSVSTVAAVEQFLAGLGNGQFNYAATAPYLIGLNNTQGTFPAPAFVASGTIGGDSYSGFSSTIGPGSGSPMFNDIDTASGSASRNFSFEASGAVDLSANYSRNFARTTTGGSPIYSYTETYAISRSLTGGTLAEFGGDNTAVFVRVTGPSITTSGTVTLTASGSYPSSLVPGTTSFGPQTITYPSSESLSLILGVPASQLPASGQYSYQLFGASSPVFTNGQGGLGKFSGTMQILFGGVPSQLYHNTGGTPLFTSYSSNIPGLVVGLSLAVTMPNDATYTLQTIGGAANPSAQLSQYEANTGVVLSQGPYGQPYRFSGNTLVSVPTGAIACPSGGAACSASILGLLFGVGGTHAGLAYYIGQLQGSTPGINGVALFRR
jgi:hypothetical protein